MQRSEKLHCHHDRAGRRGRALALLQWPPVYAALVEGRRSCTTARKTFQFYIWQHPGEAKSIYKDRLEFSMA